MWDETIASIPSNWHICNGGAGTPDLRDKFVRCAHNQAAMGNTGGADDHSHGFVGDGHIHLIEPGPPNELQAGTGYDDLVRSSSVTGTTGVVDNRPAHYELAFIKRIA